jgi:hypothetical protein
LPLPTRQRRPGYISLLVVLVVGLAAVGGYLYTQAGRKVPVVVVVSQVPAGQVVARSDLSTVEVAGSVRAIAGANLSSAVGKVAAVTLLPGMLLQRSMIADGQLIAPGQAQVGVAVAAGNLPADGLSPGDAVQVLGVPPAASAASDADPVARVLAPAATVFAAQADPGRPGGFLVTLVVTTGQARAIAAAGAVGRVALVRVSS